MCHHGNQKPGGKWVNGKMLVENLVAEVGSNVSTNTLLL